MKKKILTTLSVVLILGLAALGILAYLSDTDSDVNVMTLGNVSITQHEYERVQNADGTYEMVTSTKYGEGYKLQEFTQAKPLYPATGAITGWGNIVPFDQIEGASGTQKVFAGLNNVQDKFVLVENTGKSDAYVRTLIALEYGSNTKDIIGISTGDFWTWNDIGIIQIEGNNYYLFEAVYKGSNSRHINGVLPAGEYTYNSLGQVYLKNEATNEDCEALDGNKNGTYDILVFSEAVQVKGFETVGAEAALDEAFYNVTKIQHPWASGVEIPAVVSTADEAFSSFDSFDKSGESGTIVLNSNYNTLAAAKHWSSNREYALRDAGTDVTFDLNGYTVNHNSTYQDGKNTGYTYLFTTAYNGKLTINGEGTINSNNSEGNCCIVYAQGPSEVVINGGDFKTHKGVAVWAGNNSKVTINGGSFISTGSAGDEELVYSSGGIIDIYGGFFHNKEWEKRPVNVADANRSTGFINIYGGTFVNFDPSTGGNDPDNIKVMDGYKVVSETQANEDVWYTVVPK